MEFLTLSKTYRKREKLGIISANFCSQYIDNETSIQADCRDDLPGTSRRRYALGYFLRVGL